MEKDEKRLLSGLADEAYESIQNQLSVHEELGWRSIEIRNVDGTNITRMSDEAFDAVQVAVEKRRFSVVGFGSAIANWARPITTDFARDTADLRRALPRMRRLRTRYIRVMSYPNDGLEEAEWRAEVFRRLRKLTRIAEGEGAVLLHENCDGWGSVSPENLRILVEEMDSPAFRVVFDPGNPIAHGSTPEEMWRFYHEARPYIEHFHIKDVLRESDGTPVHVYPGEGWCDLERMMADLIATGYSGAFSIEPHMAHQPGSGEEAPSPGGNPAEIYREYGRHANALMRNVLARAGDANA